MEFRELSDEEWALIEPLLRKVLNGIRTIYRL